jgi:hypothetical protein
VDETSVPILDLGHEKLFGDFLLCNIERRIIGLDALVAGCRTQFVTLVVSSDFRGDKLLSIPPFSCFGASSGHYISRA